MPTSIVDESRGFWPLVGLVLLLIAMFVGFASTTNFRKSIARPKTVSIYSNGIALNSKFLPWQRIVKIEHEKTEIENTGIRTFQFVWKFRLSNGAVVDLRLTERQDSSDYIDIEEFNRLLSGLASSRR